MSLKYFAALLLLPASWWFFHASPKPKPGTIVLLNGTSSAGKTAINTELQLILGDSYETVSGDNFLAEYIKHHPVDESMSKDETERHLLSALLLHIKQLSLSGKNVLADIILFDKNYDHYCSILGNDKTVKVLVYCPFDVIADRVQKRNESGDASEKRTTIQAFSQFKHTYKLQTSVNEMVVDRVSTSSIKHGLQAVEQEIRDLAQKFGDDPEVKIKKIVNTFVQQFKLDTLQEITLVPQHPWDLIVNTSTHSPAEIAQTIAQKIKGAL